MGIHQKSSSPQINPNHITLLSTLFRYHYSNPDFNPKSKGGELFWWIPGMVSRLSSLHYVV